MVEWLTALISQKIYWGENAKCDIYQISNISQLFWGKNILIFTLPEWGRLPGLQTDQGAADGEMVMYQFQNVDSLVQKRYWCRKLVQKMLVQKDIGAKKYLELGEVGDQAGKRVWRKHLQISDDDDDYNVDFADDDVGENVDDVDEANDD